MKTTISHVLEAGETWKAFGMEQPNDRFAHDAEYRECPFCTWRGPALGRVADDVAELRALTLLDPGDAK